MMVNPARILAAAGVEFQKRATTTWTDVISTSLDLWSEATSATVFGYLETTLVVSGGTAAISTITRTTSSTFSWATSPLLTPSPLDPACSTAYWAFQRDLYFVEDVTEYIPTFLVGAIDECLPSGYHTVNYYSPGICPSGMTLGATVLVSTSSLETAGQCCYRYISSGILSSASLTRNSGYTYDTSGFCSSYLNPGVMSASSVTSKNSETGPITRWTVTAVYTTIENSTSVYSTPIVSGSEMITAPTTSITTVATSTGLTIVSGELAAMLLQANLYIRWQSTDEAVMNWLSGQTLPSSTTNGTLPNSSNSLSSGVIAGIAIGAIFGLALIIAFVFLLLRRRKQQKMMDNGAPANMEENKEPGTGSPAPAYVADVFPKSELDSRALSYAEYSAQGQAPHLSGAHQPSAPPLVATATSLSELPVNSPRQSIAGGAAPPERSRSPSEWNDGQNPIDDLTEVLPTDAYNSLAIAPGSARPQSTLALLEQQNRVKEEKARLQRLQELSEMEARLEEQIQRDLAAERQ